MALFDIFQQAEIKIEFEFSKVNDKTMCVDLIATTDTCRMWPEQSGRYCITTSLILPCAIDLIFSNKNNDCDTILIGDQIVEDLFVKITNLWLDGIAVPESVIQKLSILRLDNGKCILSNYIGFNGVIRIELTEQCVFDQVMVWRRLFA